MPRQKDHANLIINDATSEIVKDSWEQFSISAEKVIWDTWQARRNCFAK